MEKEEILHVAELMRIRIDDHEQYTARVQKVLGYFDTLDEADVDSEELDFAISGVRDLRDDEHSKFAGSLIDDLKNHNGTHVRAPKLV